MSGARITTGIAAATLLAAGFLLFFHLGHYGFWIDEADTALFAQGVLQTGDTTALLDHNVYAFNNGQVLTNLRNRYTPPLQYYVAAASMYVLGENAWAGRWPFALCGLLGVGLILLWLWQQRADLWWWSLMAAAILGNASFFLYARQCRYYALAMLLSLLLAYSYVRWKGSTRALWGMSLLGAALAATQYLNYVALWVALAVDYWLWRRHEQRLTRRQWLVLLAPQALVFAALVSVWNPVGKSGLPESPGRNLLIDKLTLLAWYLRDLNACEFGVGILMLAVPLLYWKRREVWLMRGFVAALTYVLTITLCSPQPIAFTSVADIRYLSPMIPLCIYLTAGVLRSMALRCGGWIVPLALLALATNVLHFPWAMDRWRSTPWMLVNEIRANRTTPLMAASDWINEHLAPGQSVYTLPNHQTYPLMFHAPRAVYAWQLSPPVDKQFHQLPLIHLYGALPVDWIVAFGPSDQMAQAIISDLSRSGAVYERVATLDVFYDELQRPELFWRSFTEVREFDRAKEAVYVYRLVERREAEGSPAGEGASP
jgi:hypothetical protein